MFSDRSKGFSLIESMISAGILLVVVVGFIQLYTTQISSLNKVHLIQNSFLLKATLSEFLSDRATCERNFAVGGVSPVVTSGGTITSTPPTQIVDNNNIPVFTVGGLFEDDIFTLTSMGFSDFRRDGSALRGLVDFNVEFTANQSAASFAKTIKMAITVDAGGSVQTCIAVAEGLNQPWVLNEQGNLIFQGHRVAIGNTSDNVAPYSPGETVEVRGPAPENGVVHTIGAFLRLNPDVKNDRVGPGQGMDIINRIKPYKFAINTSSRTAYGVVAQELAEVIPAAVSTHPSDNFKYVSPYYFYGPLVQGVKEQDALQGQIAGKLEQIAHKLTEFETALNIEDAQ